MYIMHKISFKLLDKYNLCDILYIVETSIMMFMVGQYYLLSVKVFGGESLTFIGEAFFRMQKKFSYSYK